MCEKSFTQDNEMFSANQGLIHMVVNRFMKKCPFDREELFQIGAMGLWKAIQNFDETKGFSFSTYAVPLIVGEIKVAIRADNPVHVSRRMKENAYVIARAREKFQQNREEEPTIADLEEATGLSKEQIVEALEASRGVASLEEPYRGKEETEHACTLMETIPDGTDLQNAVVDRLVIERILAELEETERVLIRLRFFEGKTQTETAGKLQMNQVAVSRLEKRVLSKMRFMYNGKE